MFIIGADTFFFNKQPQADVYFPFRRISYYFHSLPHNFQFMWPDTSRLNSTKQLSGRSGYYSIKYSLLSVPLLPVGSCFKQTPEKSLISCRIFFHSWITAALSLQKCFCLFQMTRHCGMEIVLGNNFLLWPIRLTSFNFTKKKKKSIVERDMFADVH